MSKTYIISGGGGVGKTTIINLLKSNGFQTLPEVFTYLFLEAKKQNKIQEFWDNISRDNSLLIETQASWLKTLDNSKIAFIDRGLIETLFFADYFKIPIKHESIELAKQPYCSNIVFFLDPLPEEYFENNGIRENREETLKIHAFIR